MAGSSEPEQTGLPEQPEDASSGDKPVDEAPQRPSKPRAKTFSCTGCGASVTIRNPGQTFSVACESCGALMDTSTPAYRILHQFFTKMKRTPRIPLGTRGKMFGREWEVIGFVCRRDVQYGVMWDEYLLFNPYYGYRWLLESHGHWNFTTPIKDKPILRNNMELNGKPFKLFYAGRVEIDFVLGEFYWKLKSGDAVMMKDYIAPPEMISCELGDGEKNWSLSKYVEPSEIKKAFKPDDMPARTGIAPNQPSAAVDAWRTIRWYWLAYLCILTFIQFAYAATSPSHNIFDKQFGVVPNSKGEITTPVFTVDKNRNVVIDFKADVDNSWVYYAGDFVNDATDESFPIEQTIEYYHGYDSDGSWSEGSGSASRIFQQIPPGQYYLNLDYESGDEKGAVAARNLRISVNKDVPQWWNYWMCIFFVSVMPACYWMGARSAEVSRWADSDFNPYKSASSGDD